MNFDYIDKLILCVILIGNISFDDNFYNEENPCKVKVDHIEIITDILKINKENFLKNLVYR